MKLPIALVVVFFVSAVLAAPAPNSGSTALDLKPLANHKLKDDFHSTTFPENNLAELPTGKQKFKEIPFTIGDSLIQLGSKQVTGMPEKVEGIKVDRKFAKLHILLGTGYAADEDAVIGHFVVHYADKTEEKIDIVYGQDVRDWWTPEGTKEVTRGKTAWEGSNPPAKKQDKKLRLYLKTWENTKPKEKVVSLDFVSDQTLSAPFCVGMTVSDK